VTAATIARALNGGAAGGGWHRCRCPVHQSHGPTLALKDRPLGLIAFCHAGCRRRDILAELRRLGLLKETGAAPPAPDPETVAKRREAEAADHQRRIAIARDVWEQTAPATNTLVETYLWSRLCMVDAPPTIRLHRSLWHKESRELRPAMIGLIEHAEIGCVGVHATYLCIDGSGQATVDPVRKSFGAIRGGAVRLAPLRDDGSPLVIAEGIETTFSVMLSTGLAGWAALSTTGISQLVLPPEARRVIIAADNDASGAGQNAARRAATRFAREGRSVRIALPPIPGTDFNDLLLQRGPAAGAARYAAR
jgi:putative DNA primase/helicase